jgi:hypothetical protein
VQSVDAAVEAIEPAAHLAGELRHPGIDPVEPGIDPVEPSVNAVEPSVNAIEPSVVCGHARVEPGGVVAQVAKECGREIEVSMFLFSTVCISVLR